MMGVINDAEEMPFLIFFFKAYVVGVYLNHIKAIQVSTHNILFYREVDYETWAVVCRFRNCLIVHL